jgi:hypothetical protein
MTSSETSFTEDPRRPLGYIQEHRSSHHSLASGATKLHQNVTTSSQADQSVVEEEFAYNQPHTTASSQRSSRKHQPPMEYEEEFKGLESDYMHLVGHQH